MNNKRLVGGIFLVFTALVFLMGLLFKVLCPEVLLKQEPEKTTFLDSFAEKQAKKEEVDLQEQLETALKLLEVLGRKEEMGENDLAFNEGTRYCLEEIIANLRAHLHPDNEEVCDSP